MYKKRNRHSKQKKSSSSTKYFLVGFVIIGILSAKVFLDISNYHKDVQRLAVEKINLVNQKTSDTPTTEEITDNTNSSSDTNATTPLTPTNSAHTIPSFQVKENQLVIDGVTFNITNSDAFNDFIISSFTKLENQPAVLVTELESAESQTDNNTRMHLREIKIDYEKLLVQKKEQVKHNNGPAELSEEVYANQHGIYLIYPNQQENGKAKYTAASFGDEPMTKDNLIEKTTLFDTKRSPYTFVKELVLSPQKVKEYTLVENDSHYVLYKDNKEELNDSIEYRLEAIWFDKNSSLPTRSTSYQTVIKDAKYDYTIKEYIYSGYNEKQIIELPGDFDSQINS